VTSVVTTSFDSATISKIKEIMRIEGLNRSEVIRKAVNFYYELVVSGKKKHVMQNVTYQINQIVVANSCIETDVERAAWNLLQAARRDHVNPNFFRVHFRHLKMLEAVLKGEKPVREISVPITASSMQPQYHDVVPESSGDGINDYERVSDDIEVVGKPGVSFEDVEKSVDDILNAKPKDE